MKKHLALVLALVMVLSSFSFVSAAPDFSDMENHESAEAVSRLELLNVLKGYPDGTFKPDDTIKRAEFAAVAVRVTGLENVAVAAKGLPTGFSDVPAWHWASGYVGTAAKSGIVNGIGNGLFAPETPVKYEEAITMIVRALGYEPMAQARGGYPFGYMIVANEIDLLDGAMGVQGTWATRGFVAQITDNALEIPMMIQVGYGTDTKWVVSGDEDTDEKWLLDQMGFDTVEGVVTDVDVSDLEVYIDDEDDDDWYNVSESFDFFMTKGAEIKAWVDGDDVISYTINDDVYLDAVEGDEDEITLVTADKDYDVARDVKGDIAEVEFAKVVINDDGDVSFFEGFDFDGIILVDEVDDEMIIDLNDDEVDVEDFVIIKGGETVALEDLEEGDLVFYYADEVLDGEYEGLAIVLDESKIGEITRVYGDNSFRLDGKTYDVVNTYTPMYLDEDDLDELTGDILEGMMDEETEVKIFFNLEGDVAFIEGETGVAKTSSFYAVLTGKTVQYDGRRGDMVAFDFLNEFGEEVSYDLERTDLNDQDEIKNDLDFDDDNDSYAANTLFEVVVDEDGDVEEIWVFEASDLDELTDEFEIDDTYAKLDGVDTRLMSGTVVFYDDFDEVITLGEVDNEFSKVTSGSALEVDGRVEVVLAAETDADSDTTDYTGLVTDVEEIRGDNEFEITVEVAGKEMTFDTDGTKFPTDEDAESLLDGVWTFVVGDESQTIDEVKEVKQTLNLTVEKVNTSDKTITFVTGSAVEVVEITSDAVIYDEDFDELRLRDLEEGDMVDVYFDGTSNYWAAYVIVTDDLVVPEDPETEGVVTYINKTAEPYGFEVDGVAYVIDANTVLKDGNTTVAMGNEVKDELAVGDVVEVEDNIITRTVSVEAGLAAAKDALEIDVEAANELVEGLTGPLAVAVQDAADDAEGVLADTDATLEEVEDAKQALEDAVKAYNDAVAAKEEAEEAEAMLNSYTIAKLVTGGERWSVDVRFSEVEIADLDSLVISLYKDGNLIGEQEATQANIDLDRTGDEGKATSPFYFDGTADEFWEINETLSPGTPDEIVVTFVLAGETYTVTFTDVVV